MIRHNITVALRNLRKYPAQTAISVLGLAVGFVCLSLSALWMHYENTYDTMHKDYARIYTFQCPHHLPERAHLGNLLDLTVPGVSGTVLRDNFPEIEAMTDIGFCYEDIRVNGVLAKPMEVSKNLNEVFEFPLLAGDYGFTHLNDEIGIGEELARKLFPDEDSIVGRTVMCFDREMRIGAVLQSLGKHTIFQYDLLTCNEFPSRFGSSSQWITFVKLYETSTSDSLVARLPRIKDQYGKALDTKVIPLHKAHAVGAPTVSMQLVHLRVFFLSSILLTVCAFISYLVTFLIRLQSYGRNMALRIVNGATTWQLTTMLMTEFLIVLLASMAFGMLLVEWLHAPFVRFAGIDENLSFVFGQTVRYMGIAVVVCLLVSVVPITIVRRCTLQHSITSRQRGDIFRKAGVFVQLLISIVFIFCTVVMAQQISLLRQDDWGMRIEGSCILNLMGIYDETANIEVKYTGNSTDMAASAPILEAKAGVATHVRGLPMVEEVLENNHALIGDTPFLMWGIKVASERDGERHDVRYHMQMDPCSPYYGLKAVEGCIPHSDSIGYNDVIITEAMRDTLCLGDNAVGKTIYWFDREWVDACNVVAVVKNVHVPGSRAANQVFRSKAVLKSGWPNNYICIAFAPKMRREFAAAIDNIMATYYPNIQYSIDYTEDYYNKSMRSENNLMRLLVMMTIASILVTVFGVYSIVSLACVQRRKEIAIRKIHGATVWDVLLIFTSEYGLLVIAASIVAFMLGYLLMSEWLMQYPNRVSIAPWLYIAILFGMSVLIALSVGSRVWRTVRENPAEVVKCGN